MRQARCEVRTAEVVDAVSISRLSIELGYPADRVETIGRLEEIWDRPDHEVFVAVWSEAVVGWIQIRHSQLIVEDRYAEIVGLVVAGGRRREGIGRLLVERAESWAKEHQCSTLRLRSNVMRVESHPFYEACGFNNVRTQALHVKDL